MLALLLMATILGAPFVLYFFTGYSAATVIVGIVAGSCVPSIIVVTYLSIRDRTWPKITGGPSIAWFGARRKY